MGESTIGKDDRMSKILPNAHDNCSPISTYHS